MGNQFLDSLSYMAEAAAAAAAGGGAELGVANEWTAAQTLGLADAANGTTLRPLVVRRTTSHASNGAASLGAGVAFELEDAAGNTDSAGSLDMIWADATSTSEDAVFVLRAAVAGTVAEVGRIGAGVTPATAVGTLNDTNVCLSLGRGLWDSRITDNLFISHRDQAGTSSGHIRFTDQGQVIINGATGASGVSLRYNGTVRFNIDTTGIGFFATAPAAQQTIAGSRGGNAALADLLTKLALYGLIVDGSSA
jgi:hypothetical protein